MASNSDVETQQEEEGLVSKAIGWLVTIGFFVSIFSLMAGFYEGDISKKSSDVLVVGSDPKGKPETLETWYVFSSRPDFLLGIPALVNGWFGLQPPDVIEQGGYSISIKDAVEKGDNVIVNVGDRDLYYTYVFYGRGNIEEEFPGDEGFSVSVPPGEAVNVGKHTLFVDWSGCGKAPVFLKTSSGGLQKMGYLKRPDC